MATAIAEPPHLTADLRALYLSTVASQWRPLAEQAARQRQAPADYLAQLVHLEVTGRRERRIQRRIQDARFPMLKTLDAFSFEAQPDLDRDAVLQVFDCRFVAEAANIVFVGGVGTGKTHLSIALGMACCQHDYRPTRLAPDEPTGQVPASKSRLTHPPGTRRNPEICRLAAGPHRPLPRQPAQQRRRAAIRRRLLPQLATRRHRRGFRPPEYPPARQAARPPPPPAQMRQPTAAPRLPRRPNSQSAGCLAPPASALRPSSRRASVPRTGRGRVDR